MLEARDVILAIVYLNTKRGRHLNELGIAEIAESFGVKLDPNAVRDLIEIGLLNEKYELTPEGEELAKRAIERLEREIKKGPLGALRWFNAKLKLVPEGVKPEWLYTEE
jgi:Mn-dependent DtxR family transcriptional regulator